MTSLHYIFICIHGANLTKALSFPYIPTIQQFLSPFFCQWLIHQVMANWHVMQVLALDLRKGLSLETPNNSIKDTKKQSIQGVFRLWWRWTVRSSVDFMLILNLWVLADEGWWWNMMMWKKRQAVVSPCFTRYTDVYLYIYMYTYTISRLYMLKSNAAIEHPSSSSRKIGTS